MKKLLYIFTSIVLFLFAAMGNAYAATPEFKEVRYAFGATALIFASVIFITYMYWKKKSKTSISQHAAKFRTKTIEIISHGKRMVVTKRINVEPTKK